MANKKQTWIIRIELKENISRVVEAETEEDPGDSSDARPDVKKGRRGGSYVTADAHDDPVAEYEPHEADQYHRDCIAHQGVAVPVATDFPSDKEYAVDEDDKPDGYEYSGEGSHPRVSGERVDHRRGVRRVGLIDQCNPGLKKVENHRDYWPQGDGESRQFRRRNRSH